ncbi:CSN-associated deubiquitinating enzyme Ubp12 [Apophysomyces sp. BC1021]|nr:CSN-associated deubiquitinating enzyme Ubp12 [Apophysomyces sp. BC1021]
MSLEGSTDNSRIILLPGIDSAIESNGESGIGEDEDIQSQQLLQSMDNDDVSSIVIVDHCDETNEMLESASIPKLQPAEQLEYIEKLQKKPMIDGETWYIVARAWFGRWQAYCGRLRSTSESTRILGEQTPPGPVDNRSILVQGELKGALVMDEDIYLLPEEAWNCLCEWYVITEGEGHHKSSVVEVYPPSFRLYAVLPLATNTITTVEHSPKIILSRKSTLAALKQTALNALDLSLESELRIWELNTTAIVDRSPHIPATLLRDAVLVNELNDNKTLSEISIVAPMLAIEVKNKSTGKYPADEIEHNPTTAATCSSSRNGLEGLITLGPVGKNRNEHIIIVSEFTRSPARSKGVCGLNNLGNTCFMNSALQCLSNTPQLTQWILAGNYKNDLNRDNPLGMKGEVAEAYGTLIEKLWSASTGSIAPRDFKYTIGRFSPAFMGYQQHDSQELLSFLLDGLHEDLNRIIKKPYIELSDLDDMQDVEIAHRSWAYHKARNDSIIVDLFQGQFKSRLECNTCGKVSVTFDPFMYLSLPIPIQKKSNVKIVFVPYDPSKRLQRLTVTVDRNAAINHLRNEAAKLVNVDDPSTLLIVEIFSHKIYKIFDLYEPVAGIGNSDTVVVYELPGPVPQIPIERTNKFSFRISTNSLPISSERGNDDDENQLIVFPVYCATAAEVDGKTDPKSIKQFGEPIVLALRRKDACKLESVYSLIVQHVERFAIMKLFEEMKDTPESNSTMMEIDESSTRMSIEVDGVFQQKPIHTAAAVTAAGGRRMEPMNNLFKMKVFSENRSFGKSNSCELFPLNFASWNHAILTDLKERAEAEANERKKCEHSPDMSTEFDTQGANDDVTMSETNGSGRSLEAEEDDYEIVEDAAAVYTATAPDELQDDLEYIHTPPAADTEKLPSKAIIRQGEGILIEWRMTKAQQMFGSARRSTSYGDAAVNDEAWCDIEDCDDTNADQSVYKEPEQVTLAKCLDDFTKEEQLGEEDLWYCPKCKAHQRASKKFDLWRLPEILVVHLKRFSHSRTWRDKIDAFIDFPIEGLDLTDRVLGMDQVVSPAERLVYDLYAVDNHFGGLGGGHYTAYALNNEDNAWYNFDDSHVSKVNTNQVKTNAAYLLFFKRRAPAIKKASSQMDVVDNECDGPLASFPMKK